MKNLKKIFFIPLVFAFFSNGIDAQNKDKIDTNLQQEMKFRDPNEMIRVNIILIRQYDQMEMRMKSSVFQTKEEKRNFVVGELKRFSDETQQGVLDVLSAMPSSSVSEIQSFWISNFINCYANTEAIEELSLHPDILTIFFDSNLNVLPDFKSTVSDPTRETTYNVLKVNADKVWELGFEGEGVIVSILDTGVNYYHHDIRNNMWIHPDFPYHGYNFIDNNNNPMDHQQHGGHGTHVAGTVAGDGTSGSKTGVAPKAKIMAVKVLDPFRVSALCDGIEFSVEYGAHILNLSLGYKVDNLQEGPYSDVSQTLRSAMINVLEAGVIASVAAGNSGNSLNIRPIPYNVQTPGNCPPPWLHPDQTTVGGLSAVVCVGSTDVNDSIAYDLSRGPVTWQSIAGYNDYPYNPGMGLIRPDICAPGR